jgi:REP element-mobilizing transposase RayT
MIISTVRYFITFACYGTRIHGDESGTVDRKHNTFGHPSVETSSKRAETERGLMDYVPYSLDEDSRACVLDAIREVCGQLNWILLAAHVQLTHVHAIMDAEVQPEQIMNAFKRYASRKLNLLSHEKRQQKRWARHGSTRWLWKDEDVRQAIQYVVHQQGTPMAVFANGGVI